MENIKKANKLTLNKIQEALLIKTNKTAFLRMIFPTTLRHDEKGYLVDFIFNSDSSFQNTRSIFVNGNIIRNKKNPTYSRASQEVLNFIAENMNNYSCLTDMRELLSKNFPNIAPQIIDGLQATDNDIYPENFRKMLNNSNDCYQKLTYLVLWAVFGERINCINFSPNSTEKKSAVPNIYRYADIIGYFNSNLKFIDDIKSVELVCISGIRWITDDERVEMIQKLLAHNVKINVILGDESTNEILAQEMRNPDKAYIKISYCHEIWRKFASEYSNLITLKISKLPILHSYYSFNMKNNKSSVFYILSTYGNIGYRRRLVQKLDCTSEHYQTLKDEFEYLWKISE